MSTTIAPSPVRQSIEAMPRKELVRTAADAGYDKAANASNAALVDFLVEQAETQPTGKTPAKMTGSPETIALRLQYAACRAKIRECIKAAQQARALHQEHGTEETKLAYAFARDNHKAAIAEIKQVRPAYYASKQADEEQEDSEG